MRILGICPFYKPAYIYGGPARSVPILFEGLAANGHKVSVFTTNANGKLNFSDINPGENKIMDGVTVTYFNRDILGNYFFSSSLSLACFKYTKQYDLVYIVSTWGYPFIPGSLSSLINSKPYIVSPRTSFMQKTWRKFDLKKWTYHCLVERYLLNHSTAIHYTTVLEQSESKWLKLRPNNFIVPNPVEMKEFQELPNRGIFRAAHQIPSDTLIVLYLGRVEHRKGIDLAIRAFAQASDHIPVAHFVIAGPSEDNYQNSLEQIARDLGIVNRITFTGYLNQEQRLSALADADVFILSSYSENFGMAIVEAMASRLPVIISDQVGIADDIRSAEVGKVVPIDISLVAKALEELLNSKELRNDLGERARKFALDNYSSSNIANLFNIQLENIVSN